MAHVSQGSIDEIVLVLVAHPQTLGVPTLGDHAPPKVLGAVTDFDIPGCLQHLRPDISLHRRPLLVEGVPHAAQREDRLPWDQEVILIVPNQFILYWGDLLHNHKGICGKLPCNALVIQIKLPQRSICMDLSGIHPHSRSRLDIWRWNLNSIHPILLHCPTTLHFNPEVLIDLWHNGLDLISINVSAILSVRWFIHKCHLAVPPYTEKIGVNFVMSNTPLFAAYSANGSHFPNCHVGG